MKSIHDLMIFTEDLIEQALLNGDDELALIMEEGLASAQVAPALDTQFAELLLALLAVEERISVPDYALDTVLLLRGMLRGTNSGPNVGRFLH